MGRTLPTSTQLVQEFENKWQPYARALRKEDRELLAELFAMVRFQSAAIAYTSSAEPFEAFTLAMLGGILKRVMHLEMMLDRIGAGELAPSSTDGHPSAGDWESEHQPRLPSSDIEPR